MTQVIACASYGIMLSVLAMLAKVGTPYPPLVAITGLDSQTTQPSISIASDPQSWQQAWEKYRFSTPIANSNGISIRSAEVPPAVDFDKNEVLVVFGGVVKGVAGYTIEGSMEKATVVEVHLKPLPLPGAANVNLFSNPYGFFVFRKTKKPFDVQIPAVDKNGNFEWKSVAKVGGEAR